MHADDILLHTISCMSLYICFVKVYSRRIRITDMAYSSDKAHVPFISSLDKSRCSEANIMRRDVNVNQSEIRLLYLFPPQLRVITFLLGGERAAPESRSSHLFLLMCVTRLYVFLFRTTHKHGGTLNCCCSIMVLYMRSHLCLLGLLTNSAN